MIRLRPTLRCRPMRSGTVKRMTSALAFGAVMLSAGAVISVSPAHAQMGQGTEPVDALTSMNLYLAGRTVDRGS